MRGIARWMGLLGLAGFLFLGGWEAVGAEETAPESSGERVADKRGAADPSLFGNMYTRPVYRQLGRNVYLGGYMDFEFKALDDKAYNTFRVHRLIPFIYADVTDQIKFATEIEIEYGGPHNPKKEGELKVEFATLDYQFQEAIGFRGGLLLVPMGRVNALHDSPLQETTDRALVASTILPSTWTEAGVGFLGTVYPGETDRLDYELYVINGLAATKGAETADFKDGLKGLRGFQKEDNNVTVATVGRVAYSPFLGLEFGLSGYYGSYNAMGDLYIDIEALDFAFQSGPFELLGEAAVANIQTDPVQVTYPSGEVNRMEGYYGQVNYHFAQDVLAPGSVFTGVARLDHVNLMGYLGEGGADKQRVTLGVNFRPVENTVFKVDYQMNFEDWELNPVGVAVNNAWNFGFASYF